MSSITRFEDIPNDLFREIFEYLHALDLFLAFTSLNQRISTLLFFSPLHVVISKSHCYQEMKFLSSHLVDHVNQVISLSLEDQLRDYSSVISYFFNQYTYINLRSCQFYSIEDKSSFNSVIEKLSNLTKLVSFRIVQSKQCSLSTTTKNNLTRAILTHTSPTLQLIDLSFRYDYPELVTRISLNCTVTSLHIILQASNSYLSICTLLPILRHYRALRMLRMGIHSNLGENNQLVSTHVLPGSFRDNPPISCSMRIFHCTIQTPCNFQSLGFILGCMPNLRRFMVTVINLSPIPLQWGEVFDGQQWQQILMTHTPHLDIFDILLITDKLNRVPNSFATLNSFDGFSRIYPDWYVAIHRLPLLERVQNQQICLRGLRSSKIDRSRNTRQARIVLNMSLLPFTIAVDPPHHLFYSDIKHLYCDIPVYRSILDTQSNVQLFKNVNSLIVGLNASAVNFWEQFLRIFHICVQRPEANQDERMEKLANLIDLSCITRLDIQPYADTSHQRLVKKLLLASNRLIHLSIGTSTIFSSKLFNSISLIPVFHRLQSLNLKCKFSPDDASKLIKHFPSLIHLEFVINTPTEYRPLLDILINSLPKLSHLKLHFPPTIITDDGSSLISYIFQNRSRSFPHYPINRNVIWVKVTHELIDIHLNGCVICQ